MKPLGVITLLFLLTGLGLAQTISGTLDIQLDPARLNTLFFMLESGKLNEIPDFFFQDTFDNELTDLIIYIDETAEKSTQQMTGMELLKGSDRKEALFGENTLYVMVFWKTKNPGSSRFFNKDSTSISLSALAQTVSTGEFALFSALKFVATTFTNHSLETSKNNNDMIGRTHTSVPVLEIGKRGDTTLYFMFGKLALKPNTINRVHVGGGGAKSSCLATFGNYSPSWITTSVGLLATRHRGGAYQDSTTHFPSFDPFLFGHVYLVDRPKAPRPRYNDSCKEWRKQLSISAVFGTRLSNPLLDNLFVGVSVGHFLSKLGIVAGASYRPDDKKKKHWHFAGGITFIF